MNHRMGATMSLAIVLFVQALYVGYAFMQFAWATIWQEGEEIGHLTIILSFGLGLVAIQMIHQERTNAWIPLVIGMAIGAIGGSISLWFAMALTPGLIFIALWARSSTRGPMADHERAF